MNLKLGYQQVAQFERFVGSNTV